MAPAPAVPQPAPGARRQRHPFLWTCLAILGALLALLPLALTPASSNSYYLALVLTSLTLLPLLVRVMSGSLDLFEPIIPISLLIGLTYGVRTIYIAYNPSTTEPILSGTLPFNDFVDVALRLALASYVALLFGYFVLAAPFKVKPLWARVGGQGWPAEVPVAKIGLMDMLAVGGSALLGGTDRDTVDASTTVVGIAGDFVQTTACLLMLYFASGRNFAWMHAVLWGLLFPLAAWQSLAIGAKAFILKFFYAVLASWHYGRRRIPVALFATASAALILVVFPIVNSARDSPDTLRRLLANRSPAEFADLASQGVLSRATGIDVLSLVMKYDVSEELGNPGAYAAIPFYAFIPRAIWRDKPVINQGTEFGRLLLIPSFEGRQSIASFGMFHIGDLYVSFGATGVLVGMCILGFIYRMVYRLFDPLNTRDLGLKFLYIFVLWSMVSGFESDIPSVWSNLLKSTAVLVAVKIWLNQRAPMPTFHPPMAGMHPPFRAAR